ncbi:hypothetical protein H3146_12390 [Streptomyces sp. OF3]|uniref:Uncharacterized protein n=1 Tax=Streptomyces alkaliterrae TaxID=2213162 RepID=A0A7W3WKP6_9ACTN|nr:hypothetical protein [Streptomyces alkaliterrae]MBB1254161.1 hypothetical protein [Streptomyces alkaliterrae]
MSASTREKQHGVGLELDRPERRFALDRGAAPHLPDLTDLHGPAPLAFRLLTEVTASGGILPCDISYDEDTQTCAYEGLPPGVFMTKNPPKTYGPTQPTGQMDAPDDPGPSDD